MVALILADGDAPTRADLDAAWPGWADGVGLVIAADGGARHAAALGVLDRPVGRRRRLARRGRPGRAGRDGRADRALPPGQGRDRHRARGPRRPGPGRGPARHRRRPGRPAGRSRAGQCRPAGARRARRPAGGHPRGRGSRISLAARDRRARGAVGRAALGGAPGDTVSLLPQGGDVVGVTTDGLAFPLSDEPLAARSTRGVSNVIGAPRRDGRRPARPPARDRVACYALTMSMPDVGDVAPEVALPDETGTVHRLADQRGRWTILYFYPKDDTPGCTVEACEFRDSNATIHERGADVWGVSPQGSASQARVPREVRPAVHAARRRGPRRRRGVRLVGREAELRQDLLGHRADGRSWSTRTAASRGSGRRSSPRVTRPTCWRRSTSSRRPTPRDAGVTHEASPVGGYGRSLARKPTAGVDRAQRICADLVTIPAAR